MLHVNTSLCQGDSGSPLIVRVNGTYAKAGVHDDANCGVSGYYAEVAAGSNRTLVVGHIAKLPYTPFGVADWDGDGHQDLIVRQESTGQPLARPGAERAAAPPPSPPHKIGNGYQGYTPFGVADCDGDGHQDLLVRHDVVGRPVRRRARAPAPTAPSSCRRSAPASRTTPRSASPTVTATASRTSSLREDIGGSLYLYTGPSSSTAHVAYSYPIGTGWNGYTPFGVVDWDNNGPPDLIARNNSHGNSPLNLFPGPNSEPAPPTLARSGSATAGSLLALRPHQLGRDGHPDIIARNDSSQTLYLVPGARAVNRRRTIGLGH